MPELTVTRPSLEDTYLSLIAPHVDAATDGHSRVEPELEVVRMNAVAIGRDRTVLELKMYFREKEAVFFSFVFPILMLAVLGDLRRQFGEGDPTASTPRGSSCPAWSRPG